MIARQALPLLAVLLAGCAGSTPPSHGEAVTDAVCRQRAEQIYLIRHPQTTYNSDTYATSLRESPFSSSGSAILPTRTYADQNELQQLYNQCENGGGNLGPTPAAPPLAAPAAAP